MNKAANMASDTIKCALYNATHVFTATDTDYTTTNELATAGNYTQGGATLANKTVTTGAAVKWDADDVAWTTATFTARHAVLYDTTINATTNNLIANIDFGSDQAIVSGTFTIQFNAAGIITSA